MCERFNLNDDEMLYIKDTAKNRFDMGLHFGKAQFIFPGETYIEFNKVSKKWCNGLSYEWLYRDAPELIEINDIIRDYSQKKIIFSNLIKYLKTVDFRYIDEPIDLIDLLIEGSFLKF